MSLRYSVVGLFLCSLVLCLLAPLKSFAQAGAFNLEDWPQTADELKPVYVKAIMEQAGVHKVSFNLSPEFYVAELDKFAAFAKTQDQKLWLKTPVAQNLATIAVVHCDWNNGVPHWEFAQNYLGNQQVEQLKPLYADALARLQQDCTENPN